MAKDRQAPGKEQLASLEGRVAAMIEERRTRLRARLREGAYGSRASRRLVKTRSRLVQDLDAIESRIGALEESRRKRGRRSKEGGLRLSHLRDLVDQARRLAGPDGADDFGLDPNFIETFQPFIDVLYDRYFRVEAKGAKSGLPPEGPAILVANRGGPIAYDALMIAEAVRRAYPAKKLRFQIDPYLGSAPGLGTIFTRVGGVKEIRGNAERLIAEGQRFLFFPEGFAGASRPLAERYRLGKMDGEFAEVALRLGVPVIPVAVLGSEEAQPVVGQLPLVAKLLGWPGFPIAATGALPLPVKFCIRFGQPIAIGKAPSSARFKSRVTALRNRTKGAIEALLHDLLSARTSLFLG